MSAIITSDFRNLNAKNFKNNITSDSENVYLFIGKSDKWSTSLTGTTDVAPNSGNPVDSLLTTQDADRNMIALKSITGVDVINLIPRYNWVSGDTYSAWDDNNPDIFDRGNDVPFYVLTDSFTVYKCLYAPRSSTGTLLPSTVKPTHNPTTPGGVLTGDPVEYSDGYIWKYMYKVSATEAAKFLTNNYIPIKTVIGGSTIVLTGSGTVPSVGDTIVGATSGATAKVFSVNTNTLVVYNVRGTFNAAEAIVGAGGKTISSITLNNATTVGEFGTIDTDDTARLEFQNAATSTIKGKIYSIAIDPDDPTATTLNFGGSGYTSAPTVTILGDGSGATATATVSGGKVVRFVITNPGSNYNVAFVELSGGGGAGCVARAVLSPKNGHGSDPSAELGGYYVGVAATLTGQEGAGDFAVDTQFRQVGLIRKPKELSGGNSIPAIASTLSAVTYLTLNSGSTGTFSVGDYITNGANPPARAFIDSVQSLSGGVKKLGIHQNDKTGYVSFATTNTIEAYTGAASTSSASGVINTITPSEYVHFSGDIIFLENRTSPIQRTESQIEDIRIIVEF
jgi:hypothetical protein